jgi:hypothetical protein
MKEGVIKRMGQALPVPFSKSFLNALTKEVKTFIKEKGIVPIPAGGLYTIEEWLSLTNYPAWRKAELVELWTNHPQFTERATSGALRRFFVKLFPKDEHYVDYKHERGIWARSDTAKLMFGPLFKKMEDQIYSLEEFIKHVPVRDRADYVIDKLVRPGMEYIATDYTAYESHFTAELMRHCEFVFYKYMLKYHLDEYSVLAEVLMGKNKAFNKMIKVSVEARRMSGEMNTSLGNGFSNLIFMRTVCRINNIPIPRGVVEGDDGLFSFPSRQGPTSEMFFREGFNIKLDRYDQVYEASFCGLIFDPEDRQIITDPRKVLAAFAWTCQRYARCSRRMIMKLLRCKALSLAYQYPGCPIVASLARYGLRITRSYNVGDFLATRRDLDSYERGKYIEADAYFRKEQNKDERNVPVFTVGSNSREIVAKLFGIPAAVQEAAEAYLDQKNDLEPLELPLIADACPPSWRLYDAVYVINRPDVSRFGLFVPPLRGS